MSKMYMSRNHKYRPKMIISILFISLILMGGMFPSLGAKLLNADIDDVEEISVSKEIDGELEKEIEKDEAFDYQINVSLPESLTDYESITISDDFDERIAIEDTTVLVNDGVTDEFEVEVNDQHVSLNLNEEEIDTLLGKEITLQITSQINEDTTEGEEIENVAQIVVNNDTVLETDSVHVSVPETEELEIDIEEIEVNESETPDENETESQNNSEEEEDTTKAGKTSKKMTMNQTNNIQPLNNGSFDINGTDTYASSS